MPDKTDTQREQEYKDMLNAYVMDCIDEWIRLQKDIQDLGKEGIKI